MMDRRKGSLRFTTGQKEGGEKCILFFSLALIHDTWGIYFRLRQKQVSLILNDKLFLALENKLKNIHF
jgi:hypothetical protein